MLYFEINWDVNKVKGALKLGPYQLKKGVQVISVGNVSHHDCGSCFNDLRREIASCATNWSLHWAV